MKISTMALAALMTLGCGAEDGAGDPAATGSGSSDGKFDNFGEGGEATGETSEGEADSTGEADASGEADATGETDATGEADANGEADATGEGTGVEDPQETLEEIYGDWAPAWDVHKAHVVFPETLAAPAYGYPSVDSPFSLGGTEFWQKWSGGLNPTYSYSAGTEFGRRCMHASARRFEAIMGDPPAAIVSLLERTHWSGSFYNWNDDYSDESGWGDASGPRLWAWRTGLIKWISQTAKDGSCYLPTLELVEALAGYCLETAEDDDGEIQGCSASL